METKIPSEFFKGMNLTRAEISSFENALRLVQDADQRSVEFLNSPERLAFTPCALLVVAVANLAFNVYSHYDRHNLSVTDLQGHMKDVIRRLNELETMQGDAPSLDFYATIRKDLSAGGTKTKG